MLGLIFLAIAGSQAMPVAGPNYDNIQYLHNFTLTYSNNSLEGMGAIDNATDVNSQMAQSLKSAINLALPGYLASSRNSSTSSSGVMGSSTTVPMTSSTNMPERQKRQVMATSTTMASAPGPFGDTVASGSSGSSGTQRSSTPSPLGPASTTQPYGTDEEFYARTDLVHFHVDINDLEGSGAI
ncbi:hypothetical protein L5515_010446 [Caenorhabditis briggsae]|uniref:Uncharacterized protein n=1 Tax=Caenorhabditis briggsae TaxID=6238 RepID=A0AAE9ES26_CAEBR|nr:hypothetical protein L5515_010446 [Caenorhabditis briggsae]